MLVRECTLLQRACKIVWRTEGAVGVRFVGCWQVHWNRRVWPDRGWSVALSSRRCSSLLDLLTYYQNVVCEFESSQPRHRILGNALRERRQVRCNDAAHKTESLGAVMPSVLITGANRGIGLEFAQQYAADGKDVFASLPQFQGGEGACEIGEALRGQAWGLTADDPSAWSKMTLTEKSQVFRGDPARAVRLQTGQRLIRPGAFFQTATWNQVAAVGFGQVVFVGGWRWPASSLSKMSPKFWS